MEYMISVDVKDTFQRSGIKSFFFYQGKSSIKSLTCTIQLDREVEVEELPNFVVKRQQLLPTAKAAFASGSGETSHTDMWCF